LNLKFSFKPHTGLLVLISWHSYGFIIKQNVNGNFFYYYFYGSRIFARQMSKKRKFPRSDFDFPLVFSFFKVTKIKKKKTHSLPICVCLSGVPANFSTYQQMNFSFPLIS